MNPNSQLFLLRNGQQSGPFPFSSLCQMLDAGTVSRDDLVWCDGMPDWVPLGSLLPSLPPDDSPDPESATGFAHPLPGYSTAPDQHGFGWYIAHAFLYPFRGDGLLMLILGAILFTGLSFAGNFIFIVGAATWGYILLMLQQVIHGTAMGEDRLPNWPDFDGFGDLLMKAFQWFAVVAVCFGPTIFLGIVSDDDSDSSLILTGVTFLIGSIYFPMAILSVGMHDTVQGLNPLVVFRGMFTIPGHYLLTLLIFLGLASLQALAFYLADLIPFLGVFLNKFIELWSAIFLARVLGALYFVNRRKLSWFGE